MSPKEWEGRTWRQQLSTDFKRFIVTGRREMLRKLIQGGSGLKRVFFFFLKIGVITVCSYDSRNYPAVRKIKIMQETEGRSVGAIFLNR